MKDSSSLRRSLRLIAGSAGVLLFRRAAIGALLTSATLALPSAYLLLAAVLDLLFPSPLLPGQQAGAMQILLIPPASFLLAGYWLLAVLAAGEPVLTYLIGLAEDDPVLLLRHEAFRPASRTACLAALALPQLLRASLKPLYSANLMAVLIFGFLAVLLGYAILVRMLTVHWRFTALSATVLAIAPAAVAIGLAMALSQPLFAAVVSLPLALLLWPATGDIRRRIAAALIVRRTLGAKRFAIKDLESAVDALGIAHSPAQAQRLLQGMPADGIPEGREDLRVRLLSAARRFIEAVDSGAAALRAGGGGAALHLALAEACFFADDPHDAAAHAQEAYELGAGPQALLFLAVALFELRETESGVEACRRILALRRRGEEKMTRRLSRKAKSLLRRFEAITVEAD